jgi:hypothetical protein
MSIINQNITIRSTDDLTHRRIVLHWRSMLAPIGDRFRRFRLTGSKPCRISLVQSIQFITPTRAIMDAWVETPDGRRAEQRRRPMLYRACFDGSLLHIDAECDVEGDCLFALSFDASAPDDGLVYARSDLPRLMDFGPASLDPPRGRLSDAGADAATA